MVIPCCDSSHRGNATTKHPPKNTRQKPPQNLPMPLLVGSSAPPRAGTAASAPTPGPAASTRGGVARAPERVEELEEETEGP